MAAHIACPASRVDPPAAVEPRQQRRLLAPPSRLKSRFGQLGQAGEGWVVESLMAKKDKRKNTRIHSRREEQETAAAAA